MKISIFIIVYETAIFLPKQLALIKRFCTDEDYTIYVVNNSSVSSNQNDAIEYQANSTGAIYIKTIPISDQNNPSLSHALACNLIYEEIGINSDYCLFIDHDIFPFRYFSVKEKTENYLMVGVEQIRFTANKKIVYPYPGLLYINNTLIPKSERKLIDFTPTAKYGIMLDTGGSLHAFVCKYGENKFLFLPEKRPANDTFNGNRYSYYAEIDGWMHFINGSNWALLKNEDERINSLFRILEQKLEPPKKVTSFKLFGKTITIE